MAPNAWTAQAQTAVRCEAVGQWREAMWAWSRASLVDDADPTLQSYAFDRYYAAFYQYRHATTPRSWPWGAIAPDALPLQIQ